MIAPLDWKIWSRVPHWQDLAANLKNIPQYWSLTPLRDKRPYRENWQIEELIPRTEIEQLIVEGEKALSQRTDKIYRTYASGYGLRTGDSSDGLLAIDIDGASAQPLLDAMGTLPETVSWTSDKPGRRQLLFQIPNEYREQLRDFNRRVVTEWSELETLHDDDGKPLEILEFRYNRCQSALPPSRHPETGAYRWLRSPAQTPVAVAPEWLCHILVKFANEEKTAHEAKKRAEADHLRQLEVRKQHRELNGTVESASLEEVLAESVVRLDTDIYNWSGHNWHQSKNCWQGCCPRHQSVSGRSFHVNPSTLEWFCFGCNVGGHAAEYRYFVKTGKTKARGKEFFAIVRELAEDAGIQTLKSKPFSCISEPDPAAYAQYIAQEQEEEQIAEAEQQQKQITHSFSAIAKLTSKLKQGPEKAKTNWGFGCKDEVAVKTNNTDLKQVKEYQSSERLKAWVKLVSAGNKNIQDTSITGDGKSRNIGEATPELFGVARILYISREHRNPSTSTLNAWKDVEARHPGLYRDHLGKLRRANKGQAYVIPPNCARNKVIDALRGKNIEGADTANLICQTCPYLEQCQAGATFGYLHARAQSLKQDRVRISPDSLPDPQEFNYTNALLVWDESSELLTKTRKIKVTLPDFNQVVSALGFKLPEVASTLNPIFSILWGCLSGQIKRPNIFGWSDEQVRRLLPIQSLQELDLDAIAQSAKPDLSFLNTTAEYGVDLADLPKNLRKGFSLNDTTAAEQVNHLVDLNWLHDFLAVLTGTQIGSLRLNLGELTITVDDRRLAAIANAAKANLFLDATQDPEDLSKVLSCQLSDIVVTRSQKRELNNLEIIQINSLGRLGVGGKRSDFCQTRLKATVDGIKARHPDTKIAVFDFKNQSQPGDEKLHWWTDSRGINDLEEYNVAIAIGTPVRNLNALIAEFTILYGRAPEAGTKKIKYEVKINGLQESEAVLYFEITDSADPEFRAFVRRRVLADIHQCFGRLRANRRPHQQLKIYFIADYPLDIPVTLVKASDIAPEAATKTERLIATVMHCIEWMRDRGIKISQSSTARVSKELDPNGKGYSQQYLSKCWALLTSLLDFGSQEASDRPATPEEMEHAQDTAEVLSGVANQSPQTLVECLHEVFYHWLAPRQWHLVWEQISDKAQIKILSSLLLTLPASHLRQLIAFSEFA